MDKIVIYGGTFNPFHIGHLDMCRVVLKNHQYSKLIVIPNYLPPHKEFSGGVSAEHRLNMARLALAGESRVEVSDIEVATEEPCYTVDTVRKIREIYPHAELFLLIGEDMFIGFTSWKNWQELSAMVTLLVAPRKTGSSTTIKQKQDELARYGVKSVFLDKSPLEVSSTEIRLLFESMGKTAPVPDTVYNYIKKYSLYTSDDAIKEIERILKPKVTKDRYIHSCNVACRASEIGEMHGMDIHKLRVAGMLHDICKNTDHNVLFEILENSNVNVDIDFSASKNLLHSYAGAEFVKKELGINDEEILNSIRYHTSARRGMSKFEKIIYLADLTSSDRVYSDVHYMRGLSDSNLDRAMLFALEYIIKVLRGRGEYVCNPTISALLEYRNLFSERKENINV